MTNPEHSQMSSANQAMQATVVVGQVAGLNSSAYQRVGAWGENVVSYDKPLLSRHEFPQLLSQTLPAQIACNILQKA